MEIQDAKQARPHCELIAELLDSRQPKTEREHAAVREIERLRHDIERHIAMASELATENEALRAELAACQQDAERYRWLRGTVPESSSRWARWRLECWISGAWHELRGLHLDTCIDAARKGEGE